MDKWNRTNGNIESTFMSATPNQIDKAAIRKAGGKKEYADKVKAVLRRQHIFISTNTEQDIAVIQKKLWSGGRTGERCLSPLFEWRGIQPYN